MIKKIVFIFFPIVLLAQNATTTGTLSLYQTFECIGYRCSFTNDDNKNMTAEIQWRIQGGNWQTVASSITIPPIYIDRRTEVNDGGSMRSNPYEKTIRGSILELKRNTTYEVRAIFTDQDGVTGNNPVSESVTTWSHDQESNSGTVYNVSNNSDMSTALNSATGGDIISIGAGVSLSGVTFSASGSSGNPIKVVSASSSNNATFTSGCSVRGNYWYFEGIEFTSQVLLSSAQYVVFHNTIHKNDGIVLNSGDCQGLLVDGANIDLGSSYSNPGSDTGVYINSGVSDPSRTVIRNCTIIGGRDGVGGSTNKNLNAGFYDSDIYNNYFEGQYDDAIECEGGNVNSRIWNNEANAGHSGGPGNGIPWAFAPVVAGPIYVWNNLSHDIITYVSVKLGAPGGGYTDGQCYFFNNTFIGGDNIFDDAGGGSGQANVYARNNILQCSNTSGNDIVEHPNHTETWSFDYNDSWVSSGLSWQWEGNTYSSFSSFRSGTGQETNGISEDPGLNSEYGPESGNAPVVNAGIKIDLFKTDRNNYIRSDWDIGCTEYQGISGDNPGRVSNIKIQATKN